MPPDNTPSPAHEHPPYDRPSTSVTTTTLCTTLSINSAPSPEPPPTVYPLRLFFAGRDLPEPDSRSRAAQAVVYHAQEVSVPTQPRLSNLTDSPDSHSTPRSPPISPITTSPRRPSLQSIPLSPHKPKSPSAPTPLSRTSSLPIHLPPLRRAKSTAPRAPHHIAKHVAPASPEKLTTENGKQIFRTAWIKLGATEIARKRGRDIEFATALAFSYAPSSNQVLRVAFYDTTSPKTKNHRLIATAECRLAVLFAACGKPLSFPLRFLPVCPRDFRKCAKIPDGTLVVAAEHLNTPPQKYLLDVECNRIVRSKALGNASVRRMFYTIHGVFDKEPDSDKWVLLARSKTVEMIHRKRDGGSTQYNYFSSRRLRVQPGIIVEDHDAKAREKTPRAARGDLVTDTSSNGVLSVLGNVFGIKEKRRFFSLPGADFSLVNPETKLKLSLFEDNGHTAGFEMIADTDFSIAQLRSRELGQSSPIRVHANTVGKSILKYVEYGHDPRYFCLSLRLQGLR